MNLTRSGVKRPSGGWRAFAPLLSLLFLLGSVVGCESHTDSGDLVTQDDVSGADSTVGLPDAGGVDDVWSGSKDVAGGDEDVTSGTEDAPVATEDVGVPPEDTDGPRGLCEDDDPELVRPEGWTVATHCKEADPDYDLLFDDETVHRIDITIDSGDYADTMADLADILGGGGPPGGADVDEDPMWVPVTVAFNGYVWDEVGMRYKGNSSLRSAYSRGQRKLSFRFSFDKYEDEHPELDDQRFYGFKKMTFSNGFSDDSLIRDKVAADIFRASGVPAARGAFARVYVDFGQGETYFGLYTMIEDPSDEMLKAQFGDNDGNLYKPEDQGATWASLALDDMNKKTNEDEADYSDIEATYTALHASSSNAATWRDGLEATFDVNAFLRCLALNQTMVNWDSYGFMNHNYYVYGDPDREGRLVWFPWDLNESMLIRSGPGGGSDSTSIMLDRISSSWPMIRFLLDDPVYRERYREELAAGLQTGFEVEFVVDMMYAYHDLIAPWVVGANGESSPYSMLSSSNAFEQSISGNGGLEDHVRDRYDAVQEELGID